MNTADIIKKRREELGMSQEELAEKLGYKSRSSINKIELGLSGIPFSKIDLFAKALQVKREYLMGWSKEEEKDIEKVKTVARNEKIFAKFDKLSEKKKKLVENLINSYFDEDMEDEED